MVVHPVNSQVREINGLAGRVTGTEWVFALDEQLQKGVLTIVTSGTEWKLSGEGGPSHAVQPLLGESTRTTAGRPVCGV